MLFPALLLLGRSVRYILVPQLYVLTKVDLIATAISHSVEGARLKEAFGSPPLVKLLSSFWALTFSVNVYVTVLIVGRIIFLQRKIDALLSPPPTSPSPWHTRMRSVFRLRKSKDEEQLHNPYNDEPRSGPPAPRVSLRSRNRDAIYSATSMLLESAALFTITSAIFEGAYAAKDASTELFWPIWGQMAVCLPFSICPHDTALRNSAGNLSFINHCAGRARHCVDT